MAGFRQKLGDIRIPRRAGLALMASSAVLPVGLFAVGEGYAAQMSAWFGLPLVLLGALAWHGNGKRAVGVSRKAARRIAGQRAFVVAAFSALLGSTLVSDWPREAAVEGSVALNHAALHDKVVEARRSVLPDTKRTRFLSHHADGCSLSDMQPDYVTGVSQSRLGFVTPTIAWVNGYGDVALYIKETDRTGRVVSRLLVSDCPEEGQ